MVYGGFLTVPAEKHRGRRHAALLGNGHDRLCGEQRAARAAERAVRGDVNSLLVAVVHNLLLRQRGVVLDLVGGRNHSSLREQLLQVLDTVVGDANGFDLAGADELLHALPGRDVRVAVDNVARAIGELGDHGVVSCWMLECIRLE